MSEAVAANQSCPCCQKYKELIEGKDREIEQLRAEKVVLEYDIKQLRDKWFSKKKKKLDEKEDQNKAKPKKLGAPVGHPGHFRKIPEHLDVIEEVTLESCPICGSKDINECDGIEEHIQEDIVLPRPQVTKYRRHHFWCKKCKKVVSGKGKEELPNSYIGPKAKSVAAFLKYVVKVSNNDIKKIFEELCGLRIAASTVGGFNNQARNKCLPVYEALKEKVKSAPYIHADETGCPVNGKNYWDWIFATTTVCLHVIHESRGQKVVEEILGKKYGGILITDFLSAYNKIEAKDKQRCLVHLLRDLKKVLECTNHDDPNHIYCQRLKDTIQMAVELSERYNEDEIHEKEFIKESKALNESLKDFQFPDPQKSIIKRIAKRLLRHKDEIFTFLKYKGLPYHNNFAERMIRPSVLLRKITFGHRSANGILNHNVLMSILQTGKLNGRESIPLVKDILACRTKPSTTLCTGP